MDRSFEEIRADVLDLDRRSQERLVHEIEQQWSDETEEEVFAEAGRRLESYRRGEIGSVSPEEAVKRVRAQIRE